jgi:pantoate--beta-alanine ligase
MIKYYAKFHQSAQLQSNNIRFFRVFKSVKEMVDFRKSLNSPTESIGFIPTMGALHDGHISLMKKALSMNKTVIVSIFVNPTQFSKGEDLDKYPRQLKSDLSILKSTGIKYAFCPTDSEIYPSNPLCHVEPTNFSSIYEGIARPEFFRGVATIVCKLLNIVRPTHAFFGQKDISQCILVRRMAQDLNLPVEVVVCPTQREKDGLALSSRNVFLSQEEGELGDRALLAPMLFKSLAEGVRLWENDSRLLSGSAGSARDRKARVEGKVRRCLSRGGANDHRLTVEYVSVASHRDMREIDDERGEPPTLDGVVISAAIRMGNVRQIDNVLAGQAVKDILGDQVRSADKPAWISEHNIELLLDENYKEEE